MRNLSELIIDTTIQTTRQSPKITLFLAASVAFLLPRTRVRTPAKINVRNEAERGHAHCDDYYCELC